MCAQQCRTQISFSLCQLWIGAEEANSLESYKKKVSEIIKHPAAGLSAHSQPDRDTEETSCQLYFWPSEHQHFNRFTSSLFPFYFGSLCVFRWQSFWISEEQKLLLGPPWRMDTDRSHTWETYLRLKVKTTQVFFSFFFVFQYLFFQGCSS